LNDLLPFLLAQMCNEKAVCVKKMWGTLMDDTSLNDTLLDDRVLIDGPAHSPDRLQVRGKDLNDLVGSLSYPAAIYHLLTGELPQPTVEQQLGAWLLAAMRTATPDSPLAKAVQHSATLGASDTGAVLTGLAVGDGLGLPAALAGQLSVEPLDALGLRQHEVGLYYLAVAPLLHAYALEASNPDEMQKRLSLLADTDNYVDAVYAVVSGRHMPDATARTLFHAVLVAFHAGLGSHAPTIALPLGAISTRASTAMALAAGYTAAGPAHVGACRLVMANFAQIVDSAPSQESDALAAHTRAMLDARLAAGERVPGFGHHLFRQDPRNPHLRDFVRAQGVESPYLIVYDITAARMHEARAIHPNIDAIAAALFLVLEIAPSYGTALFLCARMADMVAHIEQARQEPPFGARRTNRRSAQAS
jgi:citrate synthase